MKKIVVSALAVVLSLGIVGTTVTALAKTKTPAPIKVQQAPIGATAKCKDGSYSFSQTRRGTCSHHGGVSKWLY